MKIDIKKIAKLARIKIEDSDIDKIESDMAEVLNSIQDLPEISDHDALVDPDHPMALRKDEISQTYCREDILKNAPQVQAGCVVVPRTMD